MTVKLGNFALQQSTTTGTGTLDLDSVSAGSPHQSMADALGLTTGGQTAKTIYFISSDGVGAEVGVGTVTKGTPDTLSRDTLIESTTGSKLSLDAGPHNVGIYMDKDSLETLIDPDASNGLLAQTDSKTYARRSITGSSEITVTNGNGVSGNPSIALANTFTQNKSIEIDSTLTEFTISNAALDTFAGGPTLNFHRSDGTHASPAAVKNGMNMGQIRFFGYDGFDFTQSLFILCRAVGDFDLDSAPSTIMIGGGGQVNLTIHKDGSIRVGAPTGGPQGHGTLNATGVYDDGSLLTCYPIEAAIDGTIDIESWDRKVPNRIYKSIDVDGEKIGEDRIEHRSHEPARRFLNTMWQLDVEKYIEYWRTNRHLPAFPGPNDFNRRLSSGEEMNMLKETVDVFAVHIETLLNKIKALEARVSALEGK